MLRFFRFHSFICQKLKLNLLNTDHNNIVSLLLIFTLTVFHVTLLDLPVTDFLSSAIATRVEDASVVTNLQVRVNKNIQTLKIKTQLRMVFKY